MTQTFSQLGLRPELAQAVADLGYETPTPIQAALIPVMLSGQDVIGQAQTGTGKTAAFALPTLHALTEERGAVQALVLVPTRELAMQVASAMHTYGRPLGARVLPVYGGQAYSRQTDRLQRGVEIVVGTPGRLLDLIRQKALDLSSVSTVVLDEADEMLSMGFIEDIQAILDETPTDRQTALLSATLPPAIRRLAERYLRDPQACTVAPQQRTGEAIEHRAYVVYAADKPAALARLLETEDFTSVLVFAHTRASTNEIAGTLAEAGYAVEALNGEMSQNARADVLRRFRDRSIKVLVATDVAARGLDIDHVSHVVNVDLPRDPDVYVHRTGRTGRAGRSGVALSLITQNQRSNLRRIEQLLKQPVTVHVLPSVEGIQQLREDRFLQRLVERLDGPARDADRKLVAQLVAEGRDPMDVAVAALGLARPDHHGQPIAPIREARGKLDVKRDRPERSKPERFKPEGGPKPERRTSERSAREPGMVRLALSAGRTAGVQPKQVVSAIARQADVPGNVIGKILIEHRETLVDVPQEYAEQVLAHSGRYRIGKHLLTVEEA